LQSIDRCLDPSHIHCYSVLSPEWRSLVRDCSRTLTESAKPYPPIPLPSPTWRNIFAHLSCSREILCPDIHNTDSQSMVSQRMRARKRCKKPSLLTNIGALCFAANVQS